MPKQTSKTGAAGKLQEGLVLWPGAEPVIEEHGPGPPRTDIENYETRFDQMELLLDETATVARLMYFRTADINDNPLVLLFDCGSQGNFISAEVVLSLHLQTSRVPRYFYRTADDSIHNNCLMVELELKEFGKVKFFVADRLNQDLILGLPWFIHMNPRVDWPSRALEWDDEKDHHRITCSTSDLNDSSRLITSTVVFSFKQFKSQLDKKEKSYLVYLNEVMTQVERHRDSFEEELRVSFPTVSAEDHIDNLPPHRPFDHNIVLEAGTEPIALRPYRLSPLEIRELKKQLEHLLETGRIRPSVSPWAFPILFSRYQI
jgi:hypothetical protein